MTSKLDYLKKYDANSTDNGKEGKKKKKKQHTTTQPRMMMVDAEVDVLPTVAPVSAPGTTTMQSSLWDVGGEDDDDGPVVIETAETLKVAKGAWTAVDDVPSIPVPSSSSSSSIQLPRRTRHDSSDDDEDVPRRRPAIASTDNTSQARTTRHDSSDEDVPRRRPAATSAAAVPEKSSQSRRIRHDSDDDDASPPRRTTVPSSSSSTVNTMQVTSTTTQQTTTNSNAASNRRQRHDSSDDDEDVPRRRPRVNDDSDEEPPRKPSIESAEVKGLPEKRKKTASGHDAGLQSSSQFGKTEKELKAQRDLELSNADPSLLGSQAETVYRDRKGKKLDMLNEFMRQQAIKEGKEVKLKEAQMEWGRGSVQKEEAALARKEMEEIANEPFARTIDNPRLEAMRKEVIRDGDPMAEYFMQKKEKEEAMVGSSSSNASGSSSSSSLLIKQKPQKPKYKGPLGLPNRFSIPPGYRWDGIDRGNRYEHKILTKQNDRTALKEDEYRWSTQDM